jgi:hypothetical protein
MFPTLGARPRAGIINLLCIIALAGCASSGAIDNRGASHPEFSGLTIRNNNWSTMTVYLVQGGARVRVGEVNGFTQAFFPAARLGMLAGGTGTFLVARPLAGRAFRSENLVFAPGRMLVWTIENQPAHSYLSVR